eukprot:scaffold10462_cov111-Skeletonema_marinoi.AAC.5
MPPPRLTSNYPAKASTRHTYGAAQHKHNIDLQDCIIVVNLLSDPSPALCSSPNSVTHSGGGTTTEEVN